MVDNLYLVTRSTFERTAWRLALRLAQSGDTICFIQDAVLAVKGPLELRDKMAELESKGVDLRFLAEDLNARSLNASREKTVDYEGLVELIEKASRIIT
ncbi:sulfurtransferase complex subunit TusB [candidate division WOR-3 bacterium]|uniref:Sulfurtransferase complex subunit TusB n=1 Tax=candidate division WOR-3 bacterium TaxID=2052148 RepID=A0A9D5KB15_UNCW3|nr:sulfurtransferase complex subunit TusB [candidate division WOR-3 bacterium]MBD3365588.1 sulfurtransferase complex subunit TusB [candidate division WOR-3 bacterium]